MLRAKRLGLVVGRGSSEFLGKINIFIFYYAKQKVNEANDLNERGAAKSSLLFEPAYFYKRTNENC